MKLKNILDSYKNSGNGSKFFIDEEGIRKRILAVVDLFPSKSAFARECGLDYRDVDNCRRGAIIGGKKIALMCKYLEIDANWILLGKGVNPLEKVK